MGTFLNTRSSSLRPYSCLWTYFNVTRFVKRDHILRFEMHIVMVQRSIFLQHYVKRGCFVVEALLEQWGGKSLGCIVRELWDGVQGICDCSECFKEIVLLWRSVSLELLVWDGISSRLVPVLYQELFHCHKIVVEKFGQFDNRQRSKPGYGPFCNSSYLLHISVQTNTWLWSSVEDYI